MSPRVRTALARTQAAQTPQGQGQQQEKVIPVPFVLQLNFSLGKGGNESLLKSDQAELLHPGAKNRDCCDHPGVPTHLWGVLCPFSWPQASSLAPGELLQGISPRQTGNQEPTKAFPCILLQTSLGSMPEMESPEGPDRSRSEPSCSLSDREQEPSPACSFWEI